MKLICGLYQFDIQWENKNKNKDIIENGLKNYLATNAQLDWLILPEFSLTGFSFESSKTELNEEDKIFFSELAFKYQLNLSFGGLIDGYNKIITLDTTGKVISSYSKIHLFSFSNEDKYYKSGNRQDFFAINDFKILPAICYDLRFSYLFWNNALNTDVFVVIANWPEARRHHWINLLKARAIENQSYVIGVNRIGEDIKLKYSGDSLIIDPSGNEILNCYNKTGIFAMEIDKSIVSDAREKFQVLKDRKEI